MDYKEYARKWLFDYGGSNGFSVSTLEQLAGWIEKAKYADEVYEMSLCCISNKVPMFHGNIYKGLIKKYEEEVHYDCLHRTVKEGEE